MSISACQKTRAFNRARRRHLTGKAPRRRIHATASILPSGVRLLPLCFFFDKPVFAKGKTAACEKTIARRRSRTGKAPRRRARAIASILPSGVRHLLLCFFFDKPVFAKDKTAACEKPIARQRLRAALYHRQSAAAQGSCHRLNPSVGRATPASPLFDKPAFAKRKTADDSNRSFEMRRRTVSLLPRSGIAPPVHFSRKLRVRPLPRGRLCIIIVVTASDAEALDIEMRFLTCPSN